MEDIINMDFRKIGYGRRGVDLSGSGLGQFAGCCDSGNENFVYMKCGEFLDFSKNC